jgi:hypothetical protein
MGGSQYLRKFIVNVPTVETTLHSITSKGNIFHWVNTQQREFVESKNKISNSPFLDIPNLQQPFELEIDGSGYALGVVLMKEGRFVCYHSYFFHGAMINYMMYDKEIFVIVHTVKKWKNYLLVKETTIHTDHHLLQYLQS